MSVDVRAAHRYTNQVAEQAGGIDVCVDAIRAQAPHGPALTDLAPNDFAFSIDTWPSTQVLTARAAAREMIKKRQGVILELRASPARFAIPMAGGFGAACAAIDELPGTLAAQLRPQGVRAVRLRAHRIRNGAFSADLPMEEAEFRQLQEDMTLLERVPILAEVASTAVFLASDHAGAITGAVANLSGGTNADLSVASPPDAGSRSNDERKPHASDAARHNRDPAVQDRDSGGRTRRSP